MAKAQSLAMVPVYYATLDKVGNDPTVPLDTLYAVAVSPQIDVLFKTYGAYRMAGRRGVGSVKVLSARATDVNLSSSPTATPAVYPTVNIVDCIDVTSVYLVDSSGKRVTPADRPNFFVENLKMIDATYLGPAAWRVSEVTNHGVTSCSGV